MRTGWLVLGAFVAIAFACGGPAGTSDDASTSGTTPPASGTGTTPTPSPTGSHTPAATPTITNVPSFANWDLHVRPAFPTACSTCHGSSGGFTLYANDTDPVNKKFWWFSTLCNRNS